MWYKLCLDGKLERFSFNFFFLIAQLPPRHQAEKKTSQFMAVGLWQMLPKDKAHYKTQFS